MGGTHTELPLMATDVMGTRDVGRLPNGGAAVCSRLHQNLVEQAAINVETWTVSVRLHGTRWSGPANPRTLEGNESGRLDPIPSAQAFRERKHIGAQRYADVRP